MLSQSASLVTQTSKKLEDKRDSTLRENYPAGKLRLRLRLRFAQNDRLYFGKLGCSPYFTL